MVALVDRVTDLRQLVAEVVDLSQVAALVGWDQETMMPPKGARYRATQQAALHGIIHERLTDRRIGDHLDRLEDPLFHPDLSDVDRAMVRVIQRTDDVALPCPQPQRLPGRVALPTLRQLAVALDERDNPIAAAVREAV
jgi:carboxypeptidase Taq